jgi:hypothetical protein
MGTLHQVTTSSLYPTLLNLHLVKEQLLLAATVVVERYVLMKENSSALT